ncbi:uncharacterized protein isoform X2 [Musca autumnalis]|uniref:uncharacterized protein isoform X1 n=1 Tax=Musca autumnalis TaxID=221902 RepID=UPI003CF139D9
MLRMSNFNENYPCPVCTRFHSISDCTRFLALCISARRRKVEQLDLCKNCLAQSHGRSDCPSRNRCFRCRGDHHSLLHPVDTGNVFFPMTATVRLYPTKADWCEMARVVIDPSHKLSAITMDAAKNYKCEIRRGYTSIRLQHHIFDRDQVHVRCVIEDTRYGKTPSAPLESIWTWDHPIVGRATIGDPSWNKPEPYHLILGADVAHQIFTGNVIGRAGQTLIHHTTFGPVFFGEGKKT